MINSKKILITGGAGFVGAHFVEHFHKNTDWDIVILDKLNYSGSLDRLRDIDVYPSMDVQFFAHDLVNPVEENLLKELEDVTHILHMAAESHVDNSIEDPMRFVMSNVVGTTNMLNLARKLPRLEHFYYFSTDEVRGPTTKDSSGFTEKDLYNPSNPYAAAKAGGDMMCTAFKNTYKLPITTTWTMNIFGERQHPEKFIPLCISKILKGEKISIHGTPDKKESGTRYYLHARNAADAYKYIIENSLEGDYNIVGEQQVSNLQVALTIGSILRKDVKYEIVDFHSSRPGHDLHYGLNGTKLKEAGWTPPKSFRESLKKTVEWYMENPKWLGL